MKNFVFLALLGVAFSCSYNADKKAVTEKAASKTEAPIASYVAKEDSVAAKAEVLTAKEVLERYPGFMFPCGTGGCAINFEAARIYKQGKQVHIIFNVLQSVEDEPEDNWQDDFRFDYAEDGHLERFLINGEKSQLSERDNKTVEEYAQKISGLRNYSTDNEVPPDGVYTYDVEQEEFRGLTSPKAAKVIIRGRHIKILNRGVLTGGKGSVIHEGTIMKHKSGVWIIAQNPADADSDEVGGCTDGPMQIDFVSKTVIIC